MDDIEYVGRVSSLKQTSIEMDNKAAQVQYFKDKAAKSKGCNLKLKPKTTELIRERFQEET